MDASFIAAAISFFVLIYSCILHEIMHAWTAWKLGDPTAKELGRITLNPIPHIDLFSSILMPTMLFFVSGGTFWLGGAKPVPINPLNFIDPRRNLTPAKGYMISCIMGPLTNLALAAAAIGVVAIVCASGSTHVLVSVKDDAPTYIGLFLSKALFINVLLACFNLIPIPPLDGSRVLRYFLPPQGQDFLDRMEVFGMAIVILFVLGGGSAFIGDMYHSIEALLGRIMGNQEAWIFTRHLYRIIS